MLLRLLRRALGDRQRLPQRRALRAQRAQLRMERSEARSRDGELLVERVEAQHRRPRLRGDRRVLSAATRSWVNGLLADSWCSEHGNGDDDHKHRPPQGRSLREHGADWYHIPQERPAQQRKQPVGPPPARRADQAQRQPEMWSFRPALRRLCVAFTENPSLLQPWSTGLPVRPSHPRRGVVISRTRRPTYWQDRIALTAAVPPLPTLRLARSRRRRSRSWGRCSNSCRSRRRSPSTSTRRFGWRGSAHRANRHELREATSRRASTSSRSAW